MIKYPAIIKKDDEGIYEVDFPDFESCYTYDNSYEESLIMAKEALSGVIEVMIEKNILPPDPSNIKEAVLIAPDEDIAFSLWLKKNRIKKNMFQKQVADILHISYQAYQRYENPRTTNPTLHRIIDLQNVFGENILSF